MNDDEKALRDAVQWITEEIVANEMYLPLPESLRSFIASEMVRNPFMGWPNLEEAEMSLNDWHWVPMGLAAK